MKRLVAIASVVLFALVAPVANGKAKAPTLADQIADCGFRWVNHSISERNFPTTRPAAPVSDMIVLSQKDLGGNYMTTAEIESTISRKGYRPATLVDQLAYAKAKWNGRDWIVALGSSWVRPGGDRHVPCLCGDDDGRELGLDWGDPEDRWRADYLFLVVRK